LRKAGLVSKFRQAAHPRRIDSQELFSLSSVRARPPRSVRTTSASKLGTKARGGKVVDIFEALKESLAATRPRREPVRQQRKRKKA